jgi:hypothetical protein
VAEDRALEERVAQNAAELERLQNELERTRNKLEDTEAEREGKRREREKLAIEIATGKAEAVRLAGEIADVRDKIAATNERLRSERQKLTDYYFEIAKQITTLDTAGLLFLLALHRELSLSPWWAAGAFGISLVAAFVSMVETGTRGISTGKLTWGNFYMTVAVVCFLGGVAYAVLAALGTG